MIMSLFVNTYDMTTDEYSVFLVSLVSFHRKREEETGRVN